MMASNAESPTSVIASVPADEANGTTYFFSSPPEARATCGQRVRLFITLYWKAILVVLTPLIFMPLPIIHRTPTVRCAYVVLVMATYWVLELLPLPVTSMLPIVLFPTMGILDSDKTCAAYMKETNMMFLGGLMVAAGVQYSKLPKRVALFTVQLVGCSHYRLTFGLTMVTMLISMWVSNAAATTMMVPIVQAILEVFEKEGFGPVYHPRSIENGKDKGEVKKEEDKNEGESPPLPTDTTICYYLTIAYASSIGGLGTLVGTATNPAFKGTFDSEFPNLAQKVNFFWFMVYSVPSMLVMQLLVWLSLMFTFMGMFRPKSAAAQQTMLASQGSAGTMKVIRQQYKDLGPATFHEKAAGMLFILSVIMYIFRNPGFMPGWADLLTDLKVKDGVTSMFIVILMFMIPMSTGFLDFFRPGATYQDLCHSKASPGVVTWAVLKDKTPWGLMFLLGGGFALAEGSKATGLSASIGASLNVLRGQNEVLILLVVVVLTQFITEFTSNVAIANLVLPVLANMAKTLPMDPLMLMVPACHACSMAFLMPVGTPPNAIVAGVAHIPTSKMAIGGMGPKIISTLVIWLSYPLYGQYVFKDRV